LQADQAIPIALVELAFMAGFMNLEIDPELSNDTLFESLTITLGIGPGSQPQIPT
jgi:hypothetical protein